MSLRKDVGERRDRTIHISSDREMATAVHVLQENVKWVKTLWRCSFKAREVQNAMSNWERD